VSPSIFNKLYEEAKSHVDRGEFIEGVSKLEKAITLVTNPLDEIKSKLELGRAYFYTGNYDVALKIYQEQVELVEELDIPSDYWLGKGLQGVGRILLKMGDYEGARDYFQNSKRVFKNNGDMIEYHRTRAWLANIYFEQGNYDKAFDVFSDASWSLRKLKDFRGFAYTLNYIGLINWAKGRFEEALDKFKINEKYHRGLDNNWGVGIALNNQAEVYRKIGDLGKALQLFRQCLEIDENAQNLDGAGISHHNIGLVLMEQGEYNLATEHLDKALDINQKIQKLRSIASVLSDSANLEHKKGNYRTAKNHFLESLEYYEKSEIEQELVFKLCNYVEFLIDAGETSEADLQLDKARKISEKHGSDVEKLRVLFTEALVHKYKQNIGSAKKIFQQAYKLAEKLKYYKLRIRINIHMAEILLSRFMIHDNDSLFKEAVDHVKEAAILSSKQQMIPFYVKTLLIDGSLHSAKLEFTKAKELMKKAREIADAKGLPAIAARAKIQLDQMDIRQKMISQIPSSNLASYEKMALKEALSYMSNSKPYSLDYSADEIYIIVFKHSSRGPTLLCSEELPFEKTESLFDRTAFFYSMAVGQGHRHHEGLYGPLPFGDEKDYSALVYSVALADKTQDDERMKGKNYCLFCIVYPNTYQELFYKRLLIESILKKNLSRVSDITDVTRERLDEAKRRLLSSLTSDKVEVTN